MDTNISKKKKKNKYIEVKKNFHSTVFKPLFKKHRTNFFI